MSHTRATLLNAFNAGTKAVNSYTATINNVTVHNNTAKFNNIHNRSVDIDLNNYSSILIVGAGKASIGCTAALENIFLRSTVKHIYGTVITKHGFKQNSTAKIQHIDIVEASHPIPDNATLQHTQSIIQLLRAATAETLVLFVLSGGASSLFECPVDGVTLNNLIEFNKNMHRSGADIIELNTLRQQLSCVKAGKSLQYINNDVAVITLVISDVIGDNLNIIGSAPTYINTNNQPKYNINDILHKYKLTSGSNKLPENVLNVLTTAKPTTPESRPNTNIQLIANNYAALVHAQRSIQQAIQLQPLIITDRLHGDVATTTEFIMSIIESCIANNQPLQAPGCLIFGGECTVQIENTVPNAQGGRNQHMALLFAQQLQYHTGITVLCASTDGNDHVDEIAGAVVDCNTYNNAIQHNIDIDKYITNHDSYHFFDTYDKLTNSQSHIKIGNTDTNVADMIIVYIDSS